MGDGREKGKRPGEEWWGSKEAVKEERVLCFSFVFLLVQDRGGGSSSKKHTQRQEQEQKQKQKSRGTGEKRKTGARRAKRVGRRAGWMLKINAQSVDAWS
jgi:hypothetical protein